MDRPTKEQVDEAMDIGACGDAEARLVLMAEVRALREELAECQRNRELATAAHDAAELRIVELREELAGVRALPAKWLADYKLGYQRLDENVVETMAEELESALKPFEGT